MRIAFCIICCKNAHYIPLEMRIVYLKECASNAAKVLTPRPHAYRIMKGIKYALYTVRNVALYTIWNAHYIPGNNAHFSTTKKCASNAAKVLTPRPHAYRIIDSIKCGSLTRCARWEFKQAGPCRHISCLVIDSLTMFCS